MPTTFLMTYRDALEHLVDFIDGLSEETAQRRARRAILSAYRDVGMLRKWRYLQTHGRIQLQAPFTTGTLTYVASTKTVTFSSAPPSWVNYAHLKITGYTPVYKCFASTGTYTVQLESKFAPTADISTPTAFTLYQSVYPLPPDMVCMEEIHDETQYWARGFITPEEWMTLERDVGTSMKPYAWTIMGSNDLIGSMQLCLHGYPPSAETLDFIYTRKPRALVYDGLLKYSSYSSGSRTSPATATVAGTTVTLVGTSVDAAVVGSVFRIGYSGASKPPESLASQDAYAYQQIITARSSGTSLTLDATPPSVSVSTWFVISDPIDLPEYLIDYFLRNCEYYMCLNSDPARASVTMKNMILARRDALARDGMEPSPQGPLSGNRWSRDIRWSTLTGTVAAYPY